MAVGYEELLIPRRRGMGQGGAMNRPIKVSLSLTYEEAEWLMYMLYADEVNPAHKFGERARRTVARAQRRFVDRGGRVSIVNHGRDLPPGKR